MPFLPAVAAVLGLVATGLLAPFAALVVGGSLMIAWLWTGQRLAGAVTPAPPPAATDAPPNDLRVIEGLADPVIVVSATREVIAANRPASELFGIGRPGRDLALSVRHPQVLAAVDRAFVRDEPATVELTMPSPPTRTVSALVMPLPATRDRGAPRLVLSFRDETPARRIEQTHADFVANASHELRSPLASLIGFIETLRGPASGDAAARERFLAIMHTEAMRMTRLIDDLMSLSRVEMSEHVPPRDPVDAHELLLGVVDALTGRAQGKGMTLDLACPEAVPEVVGDADQLIQVFHNLIDNAIKYGRPGTAITIAVRPTERSPAGEGTGVAIAVTDRGEGIDALHLPRLTERFYRVDTGRSRRLGGTGLGLAIVKHIVNRHRGRLAIESEVGRGTTVTVTLRAVPTAAARTTLEVASPPVP